jgi:hypothetical protein
MSISLESLSLMELFALLYVAKQSDGSRKLISVSSLDPNVANNGKWPGSLSGTSE